MFENCETEFSTLQSPKLSIQNIRIIIIKICLKFENSHETKINYLF